MSALGDLPVYVQPVLKMKASTAAKIADGTAYQLGGVVRDRVTGQLIELLKDAAPEEKAAEQAAAVAAEVASRFRLTSVDLTKIDIRTAAGLVLLGGAAVGGYMWVRQQLKAEEPPPVRTLVDELVEDDSTDPECLVSLRTSLKAYVDAGGQGRLTPAVIEQLLLDLAAVEAFSSEQPIVFTFDELRPFFELVTAHTPALAKAFDAELNETELGEGRDVVSLRQHLMAQRTILAKTA